jgi:hypothetical protein
VSPGLAAVGPGVAVLAGAGAVATGRSGFDGAGGSVTGTAGASRAGVSGRAAGAVLAAMPGRSVATRLAWGRAWGEILLRRFLTNPAAFGAAGGSG